MDLGTEMLSLMWGSGQAAEAVGCKGGRSAELVLTWLSVLV